MGSAERDVPGSGLQPVRVGVAGCGQIAQIMHLPFLTELPQFSVTAVYDPSPTLVAAVGDRFGVPVRCTDFRELVNHDEVDAVAVLTMEHEEVAVAAAEAGKHIFTEKPVDFTLAAIDRIIAAVERAGVTAMVGYMKRYDPGYELGAARMREMTDVRLIRAHDFAVDFEAHRPLFTLIDRDERTRASLMAREAVIDAVEREALGPDRDHLARHYHMLLMLASHDISILRGAFGDPAGVLHSDAASATDFLSVLDYGEGRRCVFEVGVGTRYLWWDEQLTAYGRDEIVEINFPNPYVPYAPTVVTIRANEGDSPVRKEIPVSHQESFRSEWLHFYDCVRNGQQPRTTLADGRADVALALAMIHAAA